MTQRFEPTDFSSPKIDLSDNAILVTGGTGSFGQRLVRNLLRTNRPRRLVIFSRDELKQSEMIQALRDEDRGTLRFFIGDVRDASRLEMAMREIDIVIHTAALKQVPAAEYNPFECIRTNVIGAENVVTGALRNGVGKVVALSSDKAANPINLYGASKLASDKIFVAANNLSGDIGTQFAVMRYGNVLGSRGSVIPFFRRLLADGATRLPITDERMTRFWISIDQGIDFVLSSLAVMRGGEIFVPKAPSMRTIELVRAISPGTPTHTVGIRPGEKLHEVLITEDDARTTLDLGDRYVIEPAFPFWRRGGYNGATPVPVAEDFRYASNTNVDWLDSGSLSALLAEERESRANDV